MSEKHSDEVKEAREMTPLERATRGGRTLRGAIGGGATGGGVIGTGIAQKTTGPEGPFRLWQRAFNDEIACLEKTIEDLDSQLTPFLIPQTETEGLEKEATPKPPQSELVGWMEGASMTVKLLRAHVERLTQRLEF